MSEQQHSPLPWQACDGGACICGMIWAADGDGLVALTGVEFLTDNADFIPTPEMAEANRRLLLTAVNGYPALLARAERAEAALAGLLADTTGYTELEAVIRQGVSEQAVRCSYCYHILVEQGHDDDCPVRIANHVWADAGGERVVGDE